MCGMRRRPGLGLRQESSSPTGRELGHPSPLSILSHFGYRWLPYSRLVNEPFKTISLHSPFWGLSCHATTTCYTFALGRGVRDRQLEPS